MPTEFHEYPKMVYRTDSAGKKVGKLCADKGAEAAWLAVAGADMPAAAAQPASTATPAATAPGSAADAALKAENEALKIEVHDLKSQLKAVEDEKGQLREALEAAKIDFQKLEADLEAATAPDPKPGDGEPDKEPEIPENWRELHHATLIALAKRFVEGVANKEDAVSVIEGVEKRRRGDA